MAIRRSGGLQLIEVLLAETIVAIVAGGPAAARLEQIVG
jgi:hypothetical protein